ncbi:cytochrome c biogenesis protein CcsA [Stratiformator vulcanicus]|uniref:Cytochrome c biogenesis protein CcsA n=1 Tax=Stratiformator vulcanicus TaxID=2527980 RepID=A0A517R2B4_9PLAN|nr:cytochrome c biogenesis protein CcsA [Stratiformator vulcanicus]QDT38020.1 Cytochrome c biogenesis protein CcsA [Stratiformator vulcanicus]
MLQVTIFCFVASYAVAFAFEATRLAKSHAILRVIAIGFTAAGLLAHSLYLYNVSQSSELPPLLSSTQDWLLMLAWTVSAFALLIAALDQKVASGLFLLPAVLALVGSALLLSGEPSVLIASADEVDHVVTRRWVMLHVSLLMLGIAGVVIGSVFSLMYLFQHRRLKHKQAPTGRINLFSLERLARWNRWSVLVSVPLLTLGLAAGYVLGAVADYDGENLTFLDPIVVASSLVWLVLAGLLGWILRSETASGRTIAFRTLLAFTLMLVTLLGLQILSGGLSLNSWHN